MQSEEMRWQNALARITSSKQKRLDSGWILLEIGMICELSPVNFSPMCSHKPFHNVSWNCFGILLQLETEEFILLSKVSPKYQPNPLKHASLNFADTSLQAEMLEEMF